MRPFKFNCENCGASLEVNPILIRIPCPYCGTVYSNTNALDLEQIEKNHQILNSYDVKLVKTDSNVVVTNAISVGNNKLISGTETVLETEAMVSTLGRATHREFVIVSNSPVLRKYEKKYFSYDRTTWKQELRSPKEFITEKRDDYMTKFNINHSLQDTYEIYKVDSLIGADEKCIKKGGIINPSLYERTEFFEEYYSIQKDLKSHSSGRLGSFDELKELVDKMLRTNVLIDIIARIRNELQAAKDTYVCQSVETVPLVGIEVSRSEVKVGSCISAEKSSYTHPLINLGDYMRSEFINYGMENLDNPKAYKAFVLAILKEVQEYTDEWRLYSVYWTQRNSVLIGFISKTSFKPAFKKWV